jgi:SAM-dependent methyltransferase
MVYLHPLAYLLGYEGVALLRALHGEHDRAFVEERFAETRRLLDASYEGVDVEFVSTEAGYGVWSQTYDLPGNGIFAIEEPVVRRILGGLPAGTALDAACGTGRHAAWLVGQGHQTIGVDSSPDMLAHARAKVPGADFRHGELHELPVRDSEVDLVVCSLALTHVADLGPVPRSADHGHLDVPEIRRTGCRAVGPDPVRQRPDSPGSV